MHKYEETNAALTRKAVEGEDGEREEEGDLEMLLGRTAILEKMLKSGKRVRPLSNLLSPSCFRSSSGLKTNHPRLIS